MIAPDDRELIRRILLHYMAGKFTVQEVHDKICRIYKVAVDATHIVIYLDKLTGCGKFCLDGNKYWRAND